MAEDALQLSGATTPTGLLELIMIHETLSPLLPGYDGGKGLRAMRLIRQCIENRTRHPDMFGAKGVVPGPNAAFAIMTVRQAFGSFADTPNFPAKFIADTNAIVRLAASPDDRRYERCHAHVANAILAATEPSPPADVVRRNLYYWRTVNHGGPRVATAFLVETVQGNTFWGQGNLPN